ncbi:MAG: MFS transporter [bacterium]|nr:MFS transporter [bacterium]
MNRTFASLAFPNYRKWFYGALIANIGTWMQRIAQTWVVLTELSEDSGVAVGTVIALQFLPTLLITPVGGLLADRVDKRRLLIVTQVGLALSSLTLGALVLLGYAELWHLYVFALVLGILAALEQPVRMTFVSELVPASSLANAVGLNATSFNGARLIGPALAGFLIAGVGSGWVFIITGLAFAGPLIAIATMRLEDMHDHSRPTRQNRGLGVAVRYVREHADIAVIISVMAVVGAFGLNFQLFISTMARDAFDRGPEDFGILNTLMGVGSLAGALLAARRTRPRTRLVVGAAAAFGVSILISAFMPTYETYAISGILVGFFATTTMNSANSTIQLASDPAVRGRVMSLYLMVFLGSTPIFSPMLGWLAEEYGARMTQALGGGLTLLAALVAMVWAWSRLGVRVTYRIRPRPRVHVINPIDHAAATSTAGELIDQSHVDDATEVARVADPPRRRRSRAPFRSSRRRNRSPE